ncbi:MAG: AMP-binding protein [Deltaproteobacteria bacterium]|nr:AMP-binding protein [Deltaproteobacteria bacterium]
MIEDVRTLGELLDKAAANWPEHEAIVYEDQRITYRQLHERVQKLAISLMRLGVQKGDKVAVLLTNLPQWAYAEYAIDKIGGVVVPLNTRYSVNELAHILAHSDATTLVMMDRFEKMDYMAMLKKICPELKASDSRNPDCENLPFLKHIILHGKKRTKGTLNLTDLFGNYSEREREELIKRQGGIMPDDLAHLPYTSGTTGKPKGVMTSHYQYIRFNLGFIKGIGGFTDKDRLLVAPPFSHNFGNSQGILTPAFCGAASIIIEAFDAKKCLELIQKEKCTFFAGSPTMYIKMLRDENFESYDLSSLRAGLIAAAPAPVAIIEEIKSRMDIETLVNGFGMTENSVGTSMTRPEDPPEVLSKTVGRPIWPDYEVKVTDIKTGEDLPIGQEGELCTRGPLIMKGYYKMPETTAKLVDHEGWFHTGDLAIIDGKGYIRITGRLSDVFMPGGLNVSPEDVENVLYTHPKIKQVTVLGVPDEVLGEVGAAFVEVKEEETLNDREIIDFCKDRLANYKVPKYILYTSDFPLTTSGKVQRFVLKDRAVKELDL